ncbi:putative 1-phosphatidylinositol-3-phosphate 5-kinase FAB1C isoform X2 [Phalaenopsis equestris]|uniref:putative 1-phosphatidylinositol-3-phosphate 5-kinase FAB1C isoform X2 n=1 Tax=Phalaenopsis equestris TaxID=78828 RepID=UPI0009E33778|nr:putative 1-phosphatidylinositol-3-phosphate 5-kinase FAB1C isoform X2 [Phalaenopsis equestris]
MGIVLRPLLDLCSKVNTWILEPSGCSVSKTWMSNLGDRVTCHECRLFPASHQCHRCGSLLSEPREYGERLQLHDSLIQSPIGFRHNSLPDLTQMQQFSSSTLLRCSTYRSDEEEDEDDSGRHFVSPTSEFSQDVSDVDSISISCSQESCSFKSLNSSPWDSPSRPGDNSDSPGSKAVISDQEEQVCARKPGTDAEDSYYVYDNLSPYRSHVNHKAQQTFDFEKNVCIWYPPPPEDENDDMEDGFFEYNDEDDDVEGSGVDYSSNSFISDAFPIREKPNDTKKKHIGNAVCRHFTALVLQLLKDEKIQVGNESGKERWLDIVSFLAWQAAKFVKPDTRKGGSMDPGHYVKVKCVTSGNPCESAFIKGIVCTKNVKHKRMVSQHKNPRILLLGGALEYQRVSNKLASINTVMEKESDHLKMVVSKIEAHRPNVLLVEKSVSSYAQEYLLAKEISLVLNVKRSILERISLCTGARLVPSIDYIASAQLGQCEVFRVEKVVEECALGIQPSKRSVKTLMYFEGCPRRLGCTVILRGPCLEELKKVKRVISLAIFAAYHLSLETSFLANEGATLPELPIKSPSSISENVKDAGAVAKASMSAGSSIVQPIAEKHQSPFVCSDALNLNERILKIAAEQNDHNCSLDDKLSNDISSLSTCNTLGQMESTRNVGLCQQPKCHSTIIDRIQVGDGSPVRDKKSISTYKPLISAEYADRHDYLEVPDEYYCTADSQSILVSLSSTCIPKGTVCERSQLFRIKFYGSFDKPLRRYLHEDLFDQTSSCRSCNEPADVHIRSYIHQQGSLTISVKRLTSMKLPGERDGRIWMWHRCLMCEPKDGIPPATHRVVLSDAACSLSFGKFLELSFSNHATANRLASCGHSLQKDCLRFYGFGNMVAFFRYSHVDVLSVCLPPLVLDFSCHTMQEWLRGEANLILSSLDSLHLEIFNAFEKIELKISRCDSEPIKEIIHKHILELKDVLQRDKMDYDVLLKPASVENGQISQGTLDILELNRLKRRLLIDSVMWDRRLCLLDSFSNSNGSNAKSQPQSPKEITHCINTELWTEPVFKEELSGSSVQCNVRSPSLSEKCNKKLHEEFGKHILEYNTSNFVEMDLSIETVGGYVGAAGLNLISGQCYRGDVDQLGSMGRDTSCSMGVKPRASNLSDRIDLAWTGSSQSLTGQLSSDEEADLLGQHSLLNSPRNKKLMSPVRVSSFDFALRPRNRLRQGLPPLSLHLSSVKSFDSSRVSGGMVSIPSTQEFSRRSPSSINSLGLLSGHKSVFISSVSCTASEAARLLIPQKGQIDVVIALYDNEPTSIISYAICSQEHTNFISCKAIHHEINSEDVILNTGLASSSVSQFQGDDTHPMGHGLDESKPLHGSRIADHKNVHFKFAFDDDYSIKGHRVKFSVTCYFAKQFDALRKKCCPNDLDFIRSLSRCKKWNAQGGKSNVYFAKSLDERFIIKQVTRTELDSFEDFAPDYFNYLTNSINTGSPTCLAKVLGIYQVTVKHLKGGREVKMDLMVMENLLYGRNVSRVYDLKGSLRARYNADTSGSNTVLMDLNLLETLRTKPIFLSSKAKRKFERAIWNDTSFLASIDVMDYSLLVGVDEKKKELVIGIIDYMRQYTWDKQLETWVKAAGILGGSSKNSSPTVISPLQYKKRFRKAMSNYFLTVPDQWSS